MENLIIYKGYEIKKVNSSTFETTLKNGTRAINTNLHFTKVIINKDIKSN